LADALATYVHPSVLICDEVGYLTYGTDAANMLFHVVNDRHRKKRAMIFTTNKALSAWGRVLHDEDLAGRWTRHRVGLRATRRWLLSVGHDPVSTCCVVRSEVQRTALSPRVPSGHVSSANRPA
jgi:hypothetical protein